MKVNSSVVGVDIGGTYTKYALVENGVIVEKEIIDSGIGNQQISDIIQSLLSKYNAPLALGVAGSVYDNTVLSSTHLQLKNFSPQNIFGSDKILCCVNDNTAACAGEIYDKENLVYLGIGTGVCGKIAWQGNIIEGSHGNGGEVGHSKLPGHNDPCGCGQSGCVELYCGWKGMKQLVEEKTGESITNPSQVLAYPEITEKALYSISFAASILVAAIDPDYLRLGGGVSHAWGNVMIEYLKKSVPELCETGKNVDISLANKEGSLLGVVQLAKKITNNT